MPLVLAAVLLVGFTAAVLPTASAIPVCGVSTSSASCTTQDVRFCDDAFCVKVLSGDTYKIEY